MDKWQDQGIVLGVRAHGENGGIVQLLTPSQGRVAGYVRGARSSKMRGTLEIGSVVDANWQSRTDDGLGTYMLELHKSYAAVVMGDAVKLSAMQSACALCAWGLPEREAHDGLYYGLLALFDQFESPVWGAAYIMWEIAFLKELGFSLDLTACAGGGDDRTLAYVSPKTGRAVSHSAGAPYKDKLLKMPDFLKPQGGEPDEEEVAKGLDMTGYFLEWWVFAHHSHGIPPQRLLFAERFARSVAEQDTQIPTPVGHYGAK
ncbi:MAG: DNA repair protein RecO [Micavibrio sp.]|nr:DNA repair protein RecO [Micavibrio sp.]